METLILVVLFSLAWGSFLNVVIYRLPLGMSLVKPPSSCPRCKEPIRPYHNIPVVSYLLLRGKCRYCGAPIPFTYFLVEVMTPLALVILYTRYGLSLFFFAACLFSSALVVLSMIDFYHKLLPDKITLPGAALGLAYAFFRPDLTALQALLGAAVGAGFLLVVYGAYYLVRKKEGLGLGDVTMMLMVGAFLGWRETLLTLILASIFGSIIGIAMILVKKKNLQYSLPFGTFLGPAAYVSLVWGARIISIYMGLFPGR
jgi:leader peptidase (prepilin peptidase)/N-methyltransferase